MFHTMCITKIRRWGQLRRALLKRSIFSISTSFYGVEIKIIPLFKMSDYKIPDDSEGLIKAEQNPTITGYQGHIVTLNGSFWLINELKNGLQTFLFFIWKMSNLHGDYVY